MSDQAMPTPETQNAQAEPAEQGSMEAAAQAFEARNQLTEPQPEEPAAEAAQSDSEAEPVAGEPADDTATEQELAEVDIGGVKVRVAADKADEVQKALLRQSDYSRKMNEVSAKEKAYAERLEAAERLAATVEKRAETLAEVKALDQSIKAYEGIDWAKAEAENPAQAAVAAVKLMQLQQRREAALNAAKTIDTEYSQTQGQLLAEKRSEMVKTLEKDLKGWGDELGAAITKYAVDSGYTVKDIQQVTDPKWVIAMDKARKFDAIQAGKAAVKAKAQDAPPVLKPGAPRKTDAASDALSRLRQSGSQADAEAVFRSRMR